MNQAPARSQRKRTRTAQARPFPAARSSGGFGQEFRRAAPRAVPPNRPPSPSGSFRCFHATSSKFLQIRLQLAARSLNRSAPPLRRYYAKSRTTWDRRVTIFIAPLRPARNRPAVEQPSRDSCRSHAVRRAYLLRLLTSRSRRGRAFRAAVRAARTRREQYQRLGEDVFDTNDLS